jgi:hypothetical protein
MISRRYKFIRDSPPSPGFEYEACGVKTRLFRILRKVEN